MKITLAMIVKASDDEAKRLDTCLTSSAKYFDEVCVTITGENKKVEEVAKKHKAVISHFDWIDDFSAARNYNFLQATGDWVVWLDADDILRGGENLRKNIQLADDNGVTGLSLMYNYSHDAEGKVEDSHWKLQAVKRGYYEWRGVIHEDLMPVKVANGASIKDVTRVHTATKKDSANSLERNLKILNKAVITEPNEPRHYFYLARCYLGTEDWQKVVEVITRYLELSDWKEERYDAMNMMGEAYLRLGNFDKAIETHTLATTQLEDAPDAYIYKARNYIQKGEWLNALTNLEIAELRDKDAVVLKRAALYDHDLYVMSAICLMQVGEFAKARSCAEMAYKNRKTEQSKELLELATEMLRDEETTLHYRSLGEALLDEPEKLQALLASMPEQIKHDPRILALSFSAESGKEWSDNSITVFCGSTPESWDGNSVRQGGIGGSETAVIEIASRMAKKGKEVTVYNQCDAPAEGIVIDGVHYMNYWQLNKLDTFNVLWLWRSPDLLDNGIKAKKVIVDMHDVSTDAVFTDKRLAQIDHVFVKTEYHKSLFPSVPSEKFVVVGNGIDLKRFEDAIQKKPHSFIYTSTPNRGLENILDVWPEIKNQIPEAELHIFYGWNTFATMNANKPAQMAWMKTMQDKMQQSGVINHGRVDQNTLAQYQKAATLWLYPTEFPEIHCITALEMQAAGVYPITTGYAALAETQVSGVKLPGDPKTEAWRKKFVEEVVKADKSVPDDELKKGYKYAASCSWENVTNTWNEHLWNTNQ